LPNPDDLVLSLLIALLFMLCNFESSEFYLNSNSFFMFWNFWSNLAQIHTILMRNNSLFVIKLLWKYLTFMFQLFIFLFLLFKFNSSDFDFLLKWILQSNLQCINFLFIFLNNQLSFLWYSNIMLLYPFFFL